MANVDSKEIDRLTLTREILCEDQAEEAIRNCPLVELCLVLPIVSVPLAAKGPGVSLNAATTMINEFRSNLLE